MGVGTDGLPKKTSECRVLKCALVKAAAKYPMAKICESIDVRRKDCAAMCKLKEVILGDFLRSILYILDNCIH